MLSFPISVFANSIHLVSIEGLIEQQIGSLIITEVYQQLDIELSIETRPGRRAQQDVSSGYKDGEVLRIFEYGEQISNVIRVPTPYYQLETRAFSLSKANLDIVSIKDMEEYRVVKVLGVKHTDIATAGLTNVHSVPNSQTMMRFLAAGRADIALTNTVDGLATIKALKLKTISAQAEPLATLDLYHYLHQRHANLVPIIDAKIQELIASGEMLSIIAKAEAAIIPQALD
ncbi:hypothetical protein DBZ36_07025 [Alginatibacterium sediminis]|uniref:Uncharacterized protein n=2 Tax=Alginatibacterium sediminis TaxID=2164068 RepID=A0A420EHQ4_9ALTE|nr:hypothetical protein DBZ36_07025 [Alginatibacterium sediminis]